MEYMGEEMMNEPMEHCEEDEARAGVLVPTEALIAMQEEIQKLRIGLDIANNMVLCVLLAYEGKDVVLTKEFIQGIIDKPKYTFDIIKGENEITISPREFTPEELEKLVK